ncbi:hypothetical protein C0416_02390 [bacterium]|nr:hypothetical protein [bacterium]
MFNKKEPEASQKKKRKGVLERVVMGVIVGGAIGSVVGLTVAPKKGKETRDYLKEKGKEVYGRGKEAGEKFMHEYGDELNAAKESTKKNGAKVWSYFKKKLLKRK